MHKALVTFQILPQVTIRLGCWFFCPSHVTNVDFQKYTDQHYVLYIWAGFKTIFHLIMFFQNGDYFSRQCIKKSICWLAQKSQTLKSASKKRRNQAQYWTAEVRKFCFILKYQLKNGWSNSIRVRPWKSKYTISYRYMVFLEFSYNSLLRRQ